MAVYSISSVLINSDAYIYLVGKNATNIKNFFLYDEGDLLDKPIFKAQDGFNIDNINDTDIYDCTPGLLIFSERFYIEMSACLNTEILFFESELIVDNKSKKCYVGKITNVQDILNKEKTIYEKDDGYPDEDSYDEEEEFIITPVLIKDINDTLFCVKNNTEYQINVFTDNFKKIVQQKALKILFTKEEQA